MVEQNTKYSFVSKRLPGRENWFSRRYETSENHVKASKAFGKKHGKERRQASAKVCQEARAKLTTEQKLAQGCGKKERARLLALLAKEKEQSAAHSVPETKRSENEKPRKIVRKPFGK